MVNPDDLPAYALIEAEFLRERTVWTLAHRVVKILRRVGYENKHYTVEVEVKVRPFTP